METPILDDHKQSCDLASAEGKSACIMPSDSKFAAGKTEYPPMHNEEQNHELKMTKGKTYRYDDEFKAKARAHQFAFRERELNNYYDEKNPQVMLTPDAAKKGLIFCDTYRGFIQNKFKSFGTSALFSNMLRSEHIPYNIFTPMEEDLSAATALFNEVIGGGISRIDKIHIEFAGKSPDRSEYLKDGTSFDTFIEYTTTENAKGGIGIEVKYTENGYRIGVKEKKDIEDPNGKYRQVSEESNYFIPSLNITSFIKANHLRQIWRNHILGYSMLRKGEIKRFHYIHLYPEGNKHFHQYAIPEYKQLLTEKGCNSFIDITYESLFRLIDSCFKQDEQRKWLEYLKKRYIVEL